MRAASKRSLSENERKGEKRGKGSYQSGEGTQGNLYGGQDGVPMLLADEAEAVSFISLQKLSCISTDCVICRHEELGLTNHWNSVACLTPLLDTPTVRVFQCLLMTKVFKG